MANPACFRLFTHCARRAASRAACTAGNNRAIRMPMIVMTTNNSTRVNPLRRAPDILALLEKMGKNRNQSGPYVRKITQEEPAPASRSYAQYCFRIPYFFSKRRQTTQEAGREKNAEF